MNHSYNALWKLSQMPGFKITSNTYGLIFEAMGITWDGTGMHMEEAIIEAMIFFSVQQQVKRILEERESS